MTLPFYKYQGTGNDFIMLDNRSHSFPVGEELILRLCDRRFGIGADGLILLESCPEADFRMVYFNSDGKESTFCGNGGRCIVAFAHHRGLIQSQTRFLAKDGIHEATLNAGTVSLKMRDVSEIRQNDNGYELFTGSPHLVTLREELDKTDVKSEGRALRQAHSPEGVNVNFIRLSPEGIQVRTYERGVEDETLSCGTGVTAAALVAHRLGKNSPVRVETPGGNLEVRFEALPDGSYTQVFLTGPARFVFEGKVEV